MRTRDKVVLVALRVREWAEKWNRRTGQFDSDLCGMCAIAAGKLHHELTKSGVKATIISCRNHCFVEWNRHVVDVTATQFGFEPVLLRKRSELRDEVWWHNSPIRCADAYQLIKHQREYQWPRNQQMRVAFLK